MDFFIIFANQHDLHCCKEILKTEVLVCAHACTEHCSQHMYYK